MRVFVEGSGEALFVRPPRKSSRNSQVLKPFLARSGSQVPQLPENTFPTRRSFLRYFTILLSSVTALLGIWGIGRFASFSSGSARNREIPPDIPARIQPDTPLHVPEAGVWITKRQSDGSLTALDDRCTHLGCRQKWNPERRLFECPCHGSEFDLEGNVKRGPANRALPRLSITTGKDKKLHLSERSSRETATRPS